MMSAETSYSPPASIKVLGNDDLVGEILSRVDSPTTLVRAALVCRRWLRRASDGAFLRRFRASHPPRLVGFFVTGDWMPRPEFVPMNTDLTSAASLRRTAGSVLHAFPEFSSPGVCDSRDGRVLFEFTDGARGPRRLAVLRDPAAGAMAKLPPRPSALTDRYHAALLPDDNATTCYHVDVHHVGRNVFVEVTVLRSGVWSVCCSAKADLTTPPGGIIPKVTLLAGGKVYMVTVAAYIICVDLATANLFAIDLPEGVTYEHFGTLVPCRGDDSVLYIFHAKGDKLSVWLRRMDNDNDQQLVAGEWVLRDTVSVKETCGHLVEPGSELASVVGVGDNAEFAFLEMGVGDNYFVIYLHLGTRKAEKVYKRDPDNDEIIQVHPFMTVGPPVFRLEQF
ncbi:hypothetical protein PR202_gb06932 [Eleusine coracana subsp. coracana]|uniref:F-box domain-containing protein n=1 Tax=Eleusine coracana subsp. coracana TaxID=191504 RepID=A0AAV5EA35_ELECO|nr:hypothetical protein QOZ80_2BG0163830 [Eleusine coracana subsp. coracana]GJN19637.1 hypothetical protein PR202_gb06932 [Eleusine coracana subsp. coracana]